MRFCGLQVLILASRDQSTTKPSESPHENTPGRLFRIFTSLLLCLDEDSFHTLAVIASGIERILADIVAITLKAIYGIQIDNLLKLGEIGDGSLFESVARNPVIHFSYRGDRPRDTRSDV